LKISYQVLKEILLFLFLAVLTIKNKLYL
jgi:hypothetical protein